MKRNSKAAKKKKPTQSALITTLPHDVLFQYLARISRLYYPTLSLVSKSFQSLLASPELYQFRSLLGYTESCLYVCIRRHGSRYSRWFTLCKKPDGNDTGYFLTKAPVPCNRYADFSNLVAVGSDMYTIGESASSPKVSILDCTSHTWREGPSLHVKLWSLTASVIDRKIYVAGCSRDGDSFTNSFHVLDTTTQIWDDPEPIPCREAKETFLRSKSASLEGKFHVITSNEEVAYNSKEGRWDLVRLVGYPSVPSRIGHYVSSTDSYCVIGNVLFSVLYREIAYEFSFA